MRSVTSVLITALLMSACRENLPLEQATRLGEREFTPQSWATASQIERGQMTASFLRKVRPKPLNRRDVEKMLGHPTGYYYYDNNPAYFVGPNTVSSIHGTGYLWVFEANKNDGSIERVFFVPEVK